MTNKDKQNKCCDKCISAVGNMAVKFCMNDSCPCHTQAPKEEKIKGNVYTGGYKIPPQKKDTSWESEFDKDINTRLDNAIEFGWTGGFERKFFINFVKQEIQKAREETLSSVIEEIEGMKVAGGNYNCGEVGCCKKPQKGSLEENDFEWQIGYNQALEDLKTLLQTKDKLK